MAPIQGNPGEGHELARYEVRPEALDRCIAAIHDRGLLRDHEPGALRYEVWQDATYPMRFVHIFCLEGRRSEPSPRRVSGGQEVRGRSLSQLRRTGGVRRVHTDRRQRRVQEGLQRTVTLSGGLASTVRRQISYEFASQGAGLMPGGSSPASSPN